MRRLTASELPEFRIWLASKRPLGLALTKLQLAIADASGTSWVTSTGEQEVWSAALRSLASSGRRAWATDAGQTAIALARGVGVDVDEFTWLFDASTAQSVCKPGIEFENESQGASRDAVAIARVMTALPLGLPAPVVTAVMSSCTHEQLWRNRQARGWRIDVAMLNSEIVAVERNRARSKLELGIDLTTTSTARNKIAIHSWLRKAGITILDKEGNPTLDRNRYDKTTVPDTDLARLRWSQFRRVRSIASRSDKLQEIRRALRGDRIYSTIVTRGTVTGRSTVARPALQNLHRDLRPLLIADAGDVLVSLDFAQVEPRVLAALAGSPAMIAAVEAGDIYAGVAIDIWGRAAIDSNEVVLPDLRAKAKTLLIAILYGYGVDSLAADLEVDTTTAKSLTAAIWNAYPELQPYVDRLRREMKDGVAELTPDGRPVPKPHADYVILNHRIQSTAADIFFASVTRVAQAVGVEHLFLGIHDELVLSVPASRAEWAKAALLEHMSTTFHGVEIGGVPVELGRAWRKA